VLNEQGVRCTWRDILRGVVPLERTREVTANTRIHVLPTRPSATAAETIRAGAISLAERYGKPPLIVADYLQALSLGSKDDRRIAVGNTIYELQGLAVELRTPVVVISSISRAGNSKEKRDSDDPYDFLNISKESGEIELAAAVVAHLDVKADCDEQGWRSARFILAKTRFGSLGIVGLRFHGASGRFEASGVAALTEYDYEILQRIHEGTFASANAVAKAAGRNRPKVLDTVRRLQRMNVVIEVAGYLAVEPEIAQAMGGQ
jgi:DNA-binding CsgD family transcriptional regulator